MEETIVSKLKEEHRQLQIMILRVERCKDPKKRFESYEEMKKVLIPHMEGEEETLYAHLKNDVHQESAEEVVEEAIYEHQEIKDMLAMLDKMDVASKEWVDLYGDLKESIQVHIEDEEAHLLPEAKEDFSRQELVDFVSEFEEAKAHASYH